jgi:phosphate uptake regulator
MEYRKIISFGKSSYIISLPKAWVKQQKLEKGDLVGIDEEGPRLIVNAKPDSEKESIEEETIIEVNGKNNAYLAKKTFTAYVRNHHKITFRGSEIKNKVKDIQRITQSLIALEIMEQTQDTIVARDFLDMNTVIIKELVRKMDIVTRTMMTEAKINLSEEDYENLNNRDKDVNRLYFLLYRVVLFSIQNPMKAMKNQKMDIIQLIKTHSVGFYIEKVADEAKRTARFSKKIKAKKEIINKFNTILEEIQNYYVQTMKAVYNKDQELALELSEKGSKLGNKISMFENEVENFNEWSKIICRVKRQAVMIRKLGQAVYTLY